MCTHLTGKSEDEIGLLSYDELEALSLGESSNLLRFRVMMSKLSNYFFDRDWIAVMELSEKQRPSKFNRIMTTGIAWYEGVASLNLARQTKESKWRDIGVASVKKLSGFAQTSKWNFQHRHQLVQAELFYTDGELDSAEATYKAAIKSAREHHYSSGEAVIHECFGLFCIENERIKQGARLLRTAVDLYERWGAKRKADELQLLVDAVDKHC